MAVPFKRKSSTRIRKGRSTKNGSFHQRMLNRSLVKCFNCQKLKMLHRLCPHCLTYRRLKMGKISEPVVAK